MPTLLDRLAQAPLAARGGSAAEPAQEVIVKPPEWDTLRRNIVDALFERMPGAAEATRDEETTNAIHQIFSSVCTELGILWSPAVLAALEKTVQDEIMGFGLLEPLLDDTSVTEIMINGPQHIFVERKGRVIETDLKFDNEAHVLRIVDHIIRPLGRRVDRKSPMVDARLPDGSRVNVIIPPASIDGTTVTIRKFSKKKLRIEDLINYGSLTAPMAEFLRACVVSRLNIIVAGGTGSGKTTLLNVLSNFIPDDERIVTIEDSAELQLNKPHIVRLEARPADIDGTGRVTIRDLVINALRMRPERIIVGEVRGGEALDMMQAMNTGHDGSLTTVHANTPRDVVSRLETITLMGGIDFPIKVIRQQISSAIDLIVQQARLRDGSRKIVQITEMQGMEGDMVILQDLFRFTEKGLDGNKKVIGDMLPTGIRPKFTPRLETAGFALPPEIFTVSPSADRGRATQITSLFDQAMIAINADRLYEAKEILTREINSNPHNDQAWMWLGAVLLDMDQTIRCLQKALALNPKNEKAREWLTFAQQLPGTGTDESSKDPEADRPVARIGQYLLDYKFITAAQLETALQAQERAKKSGKNRLVGEVLVEQGAITQDRLNLVVREQQRDINFFFKD